jgi:hypothetical protein
MRGSKRNPFNEALLGEKRNALPLPKREALLGEKRNALPLPIELQDYILLFLEGHERADLGIRTLVNPVKVPPEIQTIVRKLVLYEGRTMFRVDRRHTIFIEKLDTDGLNGYVSKMIQDNLIYYHWIKCCDTLKEMRRKIHIYSNTVTNESDFQGQNAVQYPV